MTAQEIQEILELGQEEDNNGFYDEAIKYYSKIYSVSSEAASLMALAYVNYASDHFAKVLDRYKSNDELFKAQKKTVQLINRAISIALDVYHTYPKEKEILLNASVALNQAFYLHYTIVSSGLTIAYNITEHKITVDSVIATDSAIWIELKENVDNYTSFESTKFENYHIFGPDEKTKSVKAALETVIKNAAKVAQILTYLGMEYDAHMLRACVACAVADSDHGDRMALLAARWFILRAEEIAKEAMTEEEYEGWSSIQNASVVDTYDEYAFKNEVLLRSYRKEGRKPALQKFYMPGINPPAIESCQSYMIELEAYKTLDKKNSKGDSIKLFLNVFAQIPFATIFPTILFASVISFFFGGLLQIFSPDAGLFTRALIITWMVITLLLTFIRGKLNSGEFKTKSTHRMFMAIMLLTALLFSINFFVVLVIFIILKLISSKYK